MNICLGELFLVSSDITQLFITYGRPYHPATKDTLARWVKCAMSLAGIDTKVFTAGSCRSASGSKATSMGVPLDTILKYGSWSQSSTFYRFYGRDIGDTVLSNDSNVDFGEAILKNFDTLYFD